LAHRIIEFLFIIITFIIASFLAGIAAIFWGIKFGSARCSMGVLLVVNAFIASVLGGIGNVFGAIIAGFFIGIGETLFVAYLPDQLVGLRPLFVWIVFFILLIFRPSGLFRPNIPISSDGGLIAARRQRRSRVSIPRPHLKGRVL
jgi:branched-chain amino acid transport system permease protein